MRQAQAQIVAMNPHVTAKIFLVHIENRRHGTEVVNIHGIRNEFMVSLETLSRRSLSPEI